MIWPGRPNHDIEGWDLFSKNSGSQEELKMVQHRILLRYFEWARLTCFRAAAPHFRFRPIIPLNPYARTTIKP